MQFSKSRDVNIVFQEHPFSPPYKAAIKQKAITHIFQQLSMQLFALMLHIHKSWFRFSARINIILTEINFGISRQTLGYCLRRDQQRLPSIYLPVHHPISRIIKQVSLERKDGNQIRREHRPTAAHGGNPYWLQVVQQDFCFERTFRLWTACPSNHKRVNSAEGTQFVAQLPFNAKAIPIRSQGSK